VDHFLCIGRSKLNRRINMVFLTFKGEHILIRLFGVTKTPCTSLQEFTGWGKENRGYVFLALAGNIILCFFESLPMFV